MYKFSSILVLLVSVVFQLFGSASESGHGVPRIDYSIMGLQHVYAPIYQSGVYADYRLQSIEHMAGIPLPNELNAEEEEISTLIHADLPNEVIQAAFQHRRLMQLIRQTLTKNAEATPFLDEYIYWLFSQHQLSEKAELFLEDKYGFNRAVIDDLYIVNPDDLMISSYLYLQDHGLPAKSAAVDEEYANDPLLYGDMPFYLYDWNNVKKTKVLRIPNMARDYMLHVEGEIQFDSKVNEEFYHYLKILTKKNQTQLYINLMARRDEPKTAVIENLEMDSVVADSIIVITLDRSKASDFYMQNGLFKEQNDAAQFKNDFYQQMVDPQGEYYWSTKIAGSAWNQKLREILDEVHSQYFDNMPTLTCNERVEFIELTYLHITNELVAILEPDYLNISCKNTIDRGPSLYTLVRAHQMLSSGKSLDEIYQDLVISLLVPPAALHSRNGHQFRILRFDAVLNRLVRYGSRNTSIMP